ncbi:MAG: glycosyltransferase [Bryobacteraceae bacterium]|nr:glycosyltransferase [Bryobacteraceae bacterium]
MTSKRIVFCTYGSLGDVYPFLALALELKGRGHSPVIATSPAYRRLVEQENIPFHPVRPDIDVNDPTVLRRVLDKRDGGRYVICDLLLPSLRESFDDTAAAAHRADLLVTHPMALSAFLFARKTQMPWASIALAPLSMYSAYDPPVLPGLPGAAHIAALGPFLQRRLLRMLCFLFEPQWKPFRRFEALLGLPPSPNPLFFGHSPHVALGLFSPVLAGPQPDWPESAHAVGFPFYQHPHEADDELRAFLDGGEPPIVFTLGSAAVGVPGSFFAESATAVARLGCRALFLVGRDPRNHPNLPLPPGVLAIPYAPHAVVFSRASVIVHPGGIGTTGEAMRAGRPMLVVPYSHDQPDQAARLTRLGIARAVPQERYTARVAERELRLLLENGNYRRRAAEVASRVRRETGVSTACDLLLRAAHVPAKTTVTAAIGGSHSW